MRLAELHPYWVGAGGDGVFNVDPVTGEHTPAPERHGVGIIFDCPCGCDEPVAIMLANPLDGGPALGQERHVWQRVGDTFDNLTLSPSIQRVGGCAWHGWVSGGEVRNA